MKRALFYSPWSKFTDSHGHDHDTQDYAYQLCTILNTIAPGTDINETDDFLYEIKFDDGTQTHAFPEELGFEPCLVGGEPFYHPSLKKDIVDKFAADVRIGMGIDP